VRAVTGTHSSYAYRYGFNGMEKDDEIKGAGNSLNFGARMYDNRLGRFKSVDPKWKSYPFMSTYCFAANNPIRYIDDNGEGPVNPLTGIEMDLSIADEAQILGYSGSSRRIPDYDIVSSAAWLKFLDSGPDLSGESMPSDRDIVVLSPTPNSLLTYPSSNNSYDSWLQAGKTGDYVFLENRYAESSLWTGYRDYKQVAVYKVVNNEIKEKIIYNRTSSMSSGGSFKNGAETVRVGYSAIEKHVYSSKTVKSWSQVVSTQTDWEAGRGLITNEFTEHYRTLEVTDTQTNLKTGNITSNTITRTEMYKKSVKEIK